MKPFKSHNPDAAMTRRCRPLGSCCGHVFLLQHLRETGHSLGSCRVLWGFCEALGGSAWAAGHRLSALITSYPLMESFLFLVLEKSHLPAVSGHSSETSPCSLRFKLVKTTLEKIPTPLYLYHIPFLVVWSSGPTNGLNGEETEVNSRRKKKYPLVSYHMLLSYITT